MNLSKDLPPGAKAGASSGLARNVCGLMRKIGLCALFLACALIANIAPTQAQAQRLAPFVLPTERILSYNVDISVLDDASMDVVETISVQATNNEIRSGIFREIPLRTLVDGGMYHDAAFDIQSIKRDGKDENYTVKELRSGKRIYIGEQGRMVSKGRHTYEIAYHIDSQLYNNDGRDELYWNVTGNDWGFYIQSARVSVHLPEGAKIDEFAGFTGYYGEDGEDFRVVEQRSDYLELQTTKSLAPHAGFTFGVAWQEGLVTYPGFWDKAVRLFTSNIGVVFAFLGLIASLVYFLYTWHRYGRDPKKGTVIPEFEPPKGLSPATCGFQWFKGFRGKFSDSYMFGVVLASLASKGYVTLRNGRVPGIFNVDRTSKKPEDLPAEEALVLDGMFGADNSDTFEIGKRDDKKVRTTLGTMKSIFDKEYSKRYFNSNTGVWVVGLLVVIGFFLLTVANSHSSGSDIFALIGLGVMSTVFGSIAVFFLIPSVIKALPDFVENPIASFIHFVLMVGISLTCFVPLIFFADLASDSIAPLAYTLTKLTFLVPIPFFFLIDAPTPEGQRLRTRIEGYRMYLTTAESHLINARAEFAGAQTEITEEVFEAHLPYAMALDAEDAWGDRFAESLAKSGRDPSIARNYRPNWYAGSMTGLAGAASIGSSIGSSITTATATSSAPTPSSSSSGGFSSGGGGGGFSGGGGGGGGGGGW